MYLIDSQHVYKPGLDALTLSWLPICSSKRTVFDQTSIPSFNVNRVDLTHTMPIPACATNFVSQSSISNAMQDCYLQAGNVR